MKSLTTLLQKIRIATSNIQWRWIFGATLAVFGVTQISMFLIISIYVARSSAAGNALSYAEILQFSNALGKWLGPFVFWVLTFAISMWLAIKVRVAPRTHGLVLGLIIFTAFTILEIAFSSSLEWLEFINNVIAISIAWYGSVRGEKILRNREAVYRTSQAIRGADRSGMVKAIGEQMAGSSVLMIALADKAGNVDRASAWTHLHDLDILKNIPVLPSAPEPATVLVRTQLPQSDTSIHSLLLLPLSQVGETLVVASRSRNGFSRNDIQNYLTIAEQVALSLENLKLLEQAHQMGITKERERLAAEIHDSLTQGFISIVALTEIAEAKLENYPQELRNDFQPLLDQARQTARDNLTAARQMTWALRPDLQQVVPLAESIVSLANNWASKSGISVEFSLSGDARQLHPDVETALLRTAREALNNIQKHAQASQVTVTLTYMDTLVALDVQDNGRGCDPTSLAQSDAGGGFGLKSIREQVERLGGELTIESEPGKGCTVAVALPTVM